MLSSSKNMDNTNKCHIVSNASRISSNSSLIINNNLNNGGGGGGSGGQQNNNQQQQQQQQNNDIRQQYSMAGIVQFLQYEWQRFELQRQQWDVEKAEFKARIALMQGERRGQENLKNDLVRRIKMLEYCLKQERAKFHKLKYGVDPPDQNETANELNEINFELDENLNNNGEQNNLNWKQGRQLLRHYLQEIGYTDTIIDVRSNRVRSLLGLSNLNDDSSAEKDQSKIDDKDEEDGGGDGHKRIYRREKRPIVNDSNVKDTESSVLATFEFLNSQNNIGFILDDIGVGDEDEDDDDDVIDSPFGSLGNETEEVMNEFDMMLNTRMEMNEREIKLKTPNVNKDIDLGELASLTDTDNVIDNGSSSNSTSEVRKTWAQKYILKSHYDCVRALRFHATEPLLITASDDETLKLWNINKTQPTKNKQPINTINATLDLEPVYTYRGHTSRVLSLCVNGNVFHSGSQNGEIISWSIPSNVMNLDIYDPYDPQLQFSTINNAHDDCVWSLATMTSPTSNSNILCSASADKTVKIWDTTRSICMKSLEMEDKTPTDLAVIGQTSLNTNVSSSTSLICSYDDGSLALYDVEAHSSSNPVLTFEKVPNSGSIYSIAVHPIMPIVITAHQYKLIKLWDINTGKCIYSMVAHLDEVTSVDCDPNGWYILSGSHDCSVRVWNFDNKNCVQEMTSHRKKFDEGIFDVTFHPSKPYFASAGAEGLVKVFV